MPDLVQRFRPAVSLAAAMTRLLVTSFKDCLTYGGWKLSEGFTSFWNGYDFYNLFYRGLTSNYLIKMIFLICRRADGSLARALLMQDRRGNVATVSR